MSFYTTQSVAGVEYDVIEDQNDGGGDYEWGYAALVRDPSGQLFLVRDSGCSCYGPWDGPELEPVRTWQDAIESLKEDQPFGFTDDDVASFAQKLMAIRPAPSTEAVS